MQYIAARNGSQPRRNGSPPAFVPLKVTLNSDYAFGTEERARLAGLESLWEPGSRAAVTEIGLGPGWNCLEVGAGGGSLVEWMAAQDAHVTAIDLNTEFIDHLQSESITVIQGDLRQQELPQAAFDLVHARLVLEHLQDRRQVLDRLITVLRPGGWLVIEDFDWSTFAVDAVDGDEVVNAVEACLRSMSRVGAEVNYGRRVVRDLADAGLTAVRGEGRVRVIDSASPGIAFFTHSLDSLGAEIVAAGLVSDQEVASARCALQRDAQITTPMMMAALGRRP